jgi:alcohol dehydrogenase (cytochrome c)
MRPFAAVIGDPTKGETLPAAPIARDGRAFIGNAGGDNFGVTGRMMAFDATTGGRLWSFDLVPTIAAAPSLITTRAGRHLIIDAGKASHVYAVDRATGDKIYATPVTTIANADAPLTPQGTHFCPGIDGGVEWNGPSYSPNTNMLYVNSIDRCTSVTTQSPRTLEGRVGLPWTGTASRRHPFGVPDTTRQGWITAVDADRCCPVPLQGGSADRRWRHLVRAAR